MIEATVTIHHPTGLHARPAALFVQTAGRFRSTITVEANGRQANAKSLLALLGLGAGAGTTIRIAAEGEDAAEAVETLVRLVASDFGEAAGAQG